MQTAAKVLRMCSESKTVETLAFCATEQLLVVYLPIVCSEQALVNAVLPWFCILPLSLSYSSIGTVKSRPPSQAATAMLPRVTTASAKFATPSWSSPTTARQISALCLDILRYRQQNPGRIGLEPLLHWPRQGAQIQGRLHGFEGKEILCGQQLFGQSTMPCQEKLSMVCTTLASVLGPVTSDERTTNLILSTLQPLLDHKNAKECQETAIDAS